ncbi:MAG: T9SS type A sorting domain-containing protein [Phycisphaerae bacterium]|nr:T9SS type A sorting domain-containing protein [Saprospiraceae bacterium]
MKHFLSIVALLFWVIAPTKAQSKAYFLGHSLVNFDMPSMVEGLSAAAGKAYDYDLQVGIGANLGWQWVNPYTAGGDIWDTTLTKGGFTHFILTEAVPVAGQIIWSDTYGYADKFYNYAAQHNPGIKMYIYETWSCTDSGTPIGCEWDDHDELLWRTRLTADLPLWEGIADTLLAIHPGANIFLAPAGQALAMLYDSIAAGNAAGETDILDFFHDNIHLNDKGNYLVACVMFAVIHGESPEGLPNQLYDEWGGPFEAPSPALAGLLQRLAWKTVCQYPRDGVACSSVANFEPQATPFRFYPNPAADFLTVVNDVENSISLQLSDCLGRPIRSFDLKNGQENLPLQGLPSGWYFLKTDRSDLNAQDSKAWKFWKQ